MSNNYHLGDKDTRPWGTWETVHVGPTKVIKEIMVLPHQSLSLQSHRHRQEHWIITSGEATVTIGDSVKTGQADTYFHIPKNVKHRMSNLTDNPVYFVEIQTGDILDENDITRYEDIYGRK